MQSLVLTVIGDDRAGLVEILSRTIRDNGGNWLESSMTQVVGMVAGILRVDVPAADVDALVEALQALDALTITVTLAKPREAPTLPRRLDLTLVGQDRAGIVSEVSQLLARYAVNVVELNTLTSTGPITEETLFHARATLRAAHDVDATALKADLEKLASELALDITLDEVVSI